MKRVLQLKIDQVLVLVDKDFKLKYNSTALGFFWSLLVPVFSSLVYYFVFGVMMRWRSRNYLLYLISGNFLWQFFANVVVMNGSVLMHNASLLKKTPFDRSLLIWGTYLTEGIHLLLTIPILLGLMCFYHVMPQWSAVPNLLAVLCCLTLFAIGVSYAYAATNLYFRDLERIINVVMMVWLFMSPVFIPTEAVPPAYQWVYKVNPMAGILGVWRDVFYAPGFHPGALPLLFAVALATFLLGRAIFRHLEPRFAELM